MTATAQIDATRSEAFTGKVLTDAGGLFTTLLAAIGDRLGLYRALATDGPATSPELAVRTGIDRRYAQEWLSAMYAAGYLGYDRATESYFLPPEHEPTLVDEPCPQFFGGLHQEISGIASRFELIVDAFRNGGGVPQTAFPEDTYMGMDRFTAMWHENLLLQEWIPALPRAQALLEQGARVADVGCGQGRAIIKLVQAFPNSTFVGYDVFGPNIERARANAESAGVSDRVRFVQADVVDGLGERFDVVTTFDVIHDAVDPGGILRAIRAALEESGTYVCLDINCSDDPTENVGPVATLLYGFSIFYCMTTSLAHGGEGLGTLGLHEKKLEELCRAAGFSEVRRAPLDNPFNSLYEARP